MIHEVSVPFDRRIRAVVRVDPAVPLPPLSGMTTGHDSHERSSDLAAMEQGAAEQKILEQERHAIAQVLGSLREAARQVTAAQEQQARETQRLAVELAAAMTAKLIHERIGANDFAVEEIARKVLEHLPRSQAVVVRLHPDDLALLESRLGGEPLAGPADREIRLVADNTLGRGHCKAESGGLSVLSQWEAQLEEIRQHLLRSVKHGQS